MQPISKIEQNNIPDDVYSFLQEEGWYELHAGWFNSNIDTANAYTWPEALAVAMYDRMKPALLLAKDAKSDNPST